MNLLDLLQSVRHLQKLPIARNVFPIHFDILLDWQVLQQNQINHQEHNPIIDFSSAHTKTTQIGRSEKETQNKMNKSIPTLKWKRKLTLLLLFKEIALESINNNKTFHIKLFHL